MDKAKTTRDALVFDLSGPFAHYKKIFATTSALSYPIPVKTAVYGLLAAILGLNKEDNAYLNAFKEGQCQIAIQLNNSIKTQRMHINLRPKFGSLRMGKDNRKPTLMEFIRNPSYRIAVLHEDKALMKSLQDHLEAKTSTYTPTLGLANLIAQINWVGTAKVTAIDAAGFIAVHGAIPGRRLLQLDPDNYNGNQLIEVGQYAMEMLPNREVTVRDDIIIDRQNLPINARVASPSLIEINNQQQHVVFF